MKDKRKVIGNAAIFLLVFVLTVYGVFHGEDIGALKAAIRRCKLYWLILAVACVFFFIWGESIIIWYMMDTYGIRLKKRICFLFSSVGFFFSCVTPSASGGQPMQVYYMKKEKIPIPVAAVILMVVTITYKFVLVVIGLAIILFARGFLENYLSGIRFVFYLGLWLNVFCVSFMLLLVFHPFLTKKILLAGMNLLEKLHILKKKSERLEKLNHSMELYGDTAVFLKNHPILIVKVLLITFVQRIALFAVTYFVYRAFSLSGKSWLLITSLQAVISVSVDMLPLPGGMGISESLFLTIFLPVFGDLLLPGMVLSRGLGYYSELLISALFTLVTVAVFQIKEHKAAKEQTQ